MISFATNLMRVMLLLTQLALHQFTLSWTQVDVILTIQPTNEAPAKQTLLWGNI